MEKRQKTGSYTFSKKVGMSVEKAKQRIKNMEDRPVSQNKRRAASTFVSKLYRDEDELNDLKVLAGQDNFDSDVEDKDEHAIDESKARKREAKLAEKKQQLFASNSQVMVNTKVGKLNLEKGSVVLVAVNEVYEGQYAIVNHTRNVKGYIDLKEHKNLNLEPGQLLVASVLSKGTASYQAETSGNKNRKLQLTLDPKIINRGITSENATTAMVLTGRIESRESKGYMIDLGLKDGAKAFVKAKSSEEVAEKPIGSYVRVIVQSKTSKLIRCAFMEPGSELLTPVKTDLAQVTPHTLKAGYLVSAKVAKIFSNGLEVTFLGGMTGTVFEDHLSKTSVSKYKVGEKLQALVISQDVALKKTALTLKTSLVKLESTEAPCQVGKLYNDVKVLKKVFGNSYLIKLDSQGTLCGLLHKTNIPKPEDLMSDDDAEEETKDLSDPEAKKRAKSKKKKDKKAVTSSDKDNLLELGQTLESVRVKEFNYFDAIPILSMQPSVLTSTSLDYKSLEIGSFHEGTIESVQAGRSIILKLNDFVRGTLLIEHMADHPLKVIPPKFTTVGKTIKVRVFAIDGRQVELTKKDSLMKESVSTFTSIKEVQKGMSLQGVIVASTEHGFVIKTFGGLKGLLRHDDVKQNGAKKLKSLDLKPGMAIKAYVLFVKKGSGIALTLSKKKARQDVDVATKGTANFDDILFEKSLPDEAEMAKLAKTYSSMLKSENEMCKVDKYRVAESRQSYYIVKSTNKKSPSIGLLPKVLATSFGLVRPFDQKDFTFQALTIAEREASSDLFIPIVCAKPELIELKNEFTYSDDGTSFVALIDGVNQQSGVHLTFANGISKTVALRDISTPEKLSQNYSIGQLVRVAQSQKNDRKRLSLKRAVVSAVDSQAEKRDQEALLMAFDQISRQMAQSESSSGESLRVGQKVKAQVQLVKDYGLILQLVAKDGANNSSNNMTGFIVNDQLAHLDKGYKVGQVLSECIVLDTDPEKHIVDLSERLASSGSKPVTETKKSASKSQQKAIVELNKEQYLVVSLKNDRSKIGVCLLQSLSSETMADYQRYSIGDEIDVKLVDSEQDASRQFLLTMPKLRQQAASQNTAQSNTLEEGSLITGTLKSIKGMCAFIQVGMQGKVPIIGRLHKVETSSKKDEFAQMKPGDKIEAKILKKTSEGGRTLIELTRRPQHLKCDDGLDIDACKLLSLDTLKNGDKVEALITDIVAREHVTKVSCPIQVAISPLVRSALLLSDLLDPQTVLSDASMSGSLSDYFVSKYKVGKRIQLTYNNGRFQSSSQKSSYEKGDLAIVRFVKAIKGFGITVQLDSKTFGSIELCELTDDITSNVAAQAQQQGVFIARVIDTDKKGRLQLSSRASVLDNETWRLMQPEGTSAKFMSADQQRQTNANLRNKVLKYGVSLALKQGDLVLGYVTGVSKAGCFIQVAHGVTMRAGLNELSDDQDYDFLSQVPLGRVVLARITRASENNTRFDCSLRKSLVVYGVHQVSKNDLKAGAKLSCLVLATSTDGVAFGQVKGSYYKLKIKETPEEATPGQLCQVELLKATSEKTTGRFLEFDDASFDREGAEQERHFAQIYASVQEEARKDIIEAKKTKNDQSKNNQGEPDIEQLIENKRRQTQLEEQIRDLQALEDAQDDSDEGSAIEVDSEDSDAEEIRRLQDLNKDVQDQEENEYESSSEEEKGGEDDEEMEDDDGDESGEDSMLEGIDQDSDESEAAAAAQGSDDDMDSDDEKKALKKKSGKKALRAQLEKEKEIRAKEAQMRSGDGEQPKSVNDFERLLVADYDQSYLWIQYMAFMLENLDAEAARRVAERAVKQVSMTAEDDKLNLWIAYMNLESKFGTTEQLQAVVKRALDVNDRRKVYLQLINIYRSTDNNQLVEDIYKKLCKKYHESLEIWSGYIEFLFDMRDSQKNSSGDDFTAPKTILQRALQALPKQNHINVISKFGMLEFKNGNPEHGRTMFEGIVSNYPKRMDIWSIYMDMEVKHGGGKSNQAQARHLFERCLSLPEINKKPKKMKLVFRKYMEFENSLGNQNRLAELNTRVEQYLDHFYKQEGNESESSDNENEDVAQKKEKSDDSEDAGSDEDEEMEDEEESGEAESSDDQ